MLFYLLSTIKMSISNKLFFQNSFCNFTHVFICPDKFLAFTAAEFLYCVEKVRCAVKIEFLFLILNRIKWAWHPWFKAYYDICSLWGINNCSHYLVHLSLCIHILTLKTASSAMNDNIWWQNTCKLWVWTSPDYGGCAAQFIRFLKGQQVRTVFSY